MMLIPIFLCLDLGDGEFQVDVLNQAFLPILNQTVCNERMRTKNITDDMICAGNQEGSTGTCYVSVVFILTPPSLYTYWLSFLRNMQHVTSRWIFGIESFGRPEI
jgi:hypothetical protein